MNYYGGSDDFLYQLFIAILQIHHMITSKIFSTTEHTEEHGGKTTTYY